MGVPVGTAPGAGRPETELVADEAALEEEPLIIADDPLIADPLDTDDPLEAEDAAVGPAEEAPDWVAVVVETALAAEADAEDASETVESAWRGAITAAEADRAPASAARNWAFIAGLAVVRGCKEDKRGDRA